MWIDALCIHQSGVNKRNHQVGRMDTIYQSAQRVNLWLGISDVASDYAIEAVNRRFRDVFGYYDEDVL